MAKEPEPNVETYDIDSSMEQCCEVLMNTSPGLTPCVT